MHEPNASSDSRLKIGSLFSGYGGLDLAVEHVFNAKTVWFSELNEPVARVFTRHWPDAPNLGDITTIDWTQAEPVDILIGGFPCQDVSTVGKRAGIAPGTRSGLWAHMAAAIDALQPEWVVIENVRGLLSSPATRSAYRLPLSALLTNASASSPSPGALFRTPLATDSSRGGETLDQVRARRGTIALSHQIIDFALHGPAGSPSRRAESETLWTLIDGLFNAGDDTPTPSPAGNTSPDDPHQRQPS
jgi:site-specific DNA-cytosine methylase